MHRVSIEFKHHPASGLMQILHFDWLRYAGFSLFLSTTIRVVSFIKSLSYYERIHWAIGVLR